MTTVATSKMLTNPSNVVVVGGKSAQKVKLNSIHVSTDGGSTAQIQIFDSHDATTASADQISRIYLPDAITNLEHDFHGAMLSDGILVNVSNNASATVCITINYS